MTTTRQRDRRLRAAVYCRISLAKYGDTIKVDDQARLGRKVAADRDWDVFRVYTDNSKSAWQHNRRRADWDQMLLDVEAGRIDAIIVYHGDRLIRQPWDLEVLLRLADEKGIRLASPTGERNLDSPDDRFILRIEAAQACRESDNTSRRLKYHFGLARERGEVRLGGRGGRAFGFEPDGVTIAEDDAIWIREIAGRVLAGETLGAIARDLTARGCRTTPGNRWNHQTLRKLLRRPSVAGFVTHNGEIVGVARGPAILDREMWETLNALLNRKTEEFGYTSNARKHLLSGIVQCGTCLRPMKLSTSTQGRSLHGYGCVNPDCMRRVRRSILHVDAFVTGAVIGILNDSDARGQLVSSDAVDWGAKVQELLATKARRIAEFADDDDADSDIIRMTVRRLDKRIAEARAQMADAAMPHILDDAWGIDLAGWQALSLDRRRAIIKAVVLVKILPAPRGPGFKPEYVVIEKIRRD